MMGRDNLPKPTQTPAELDAELTEALESHPDEAAVLSVYRELFIPTDNDKFIEFTGRGKTGQKFTVTHSVPLSDHCLTAHLQLFEDEEGKVSPELRSTSVGRAYTCQLESYHEKDEKGNKTGRKIARGFYFPPRAGEPFKVGVQLSSRDGKTRTVMLDLDAHRYYEAAGITPPKTAEERKAAREAVQPYLEADAQTIIDALEPYGFISYKEGSTSGGLHLWLFYRDAVSVNKAQAFFKRVLEPLKTETVEVYPKADSKSTNRCYLPLELVTPDGVVIPLNEVGFEDEIERSPITAITSTAAKKHKTNGTPSQHPRSTPVTTNNDKADEVLAALKTCALNPPASFERHEALPAFINLAKRVNREAEMLTVLASDAVHTAWGLAQDGSRDLVTWQDELKGWTTQEPPLDEDGNPKRRGIPYLEGVGFDTTTIKRALRAVERQTETASGEDITTGSEVVVNRQISEVVSDLVRRLKALELGGNPRIYSRGDGLLVEMQKGFKLQEVTKADNAKALLHDHFEPVKESENGGSSPSSFNNNHVALLLRKTDTFPPIKNVSEIPLMLPDGSILSEPGYHPEHGYFLNTAGIEITPMPVDEARALFVQTFNEFSYQAPHAGFTATLAFVLQPFLMPLIDDLTPMYAVLGSRRAGSGSGKGYLLECVYAIHKGKPYTPDGSMPATNEEMGKVLFAALSEGVTHILFDDIEHLKHRELMAAITSRAYKGRILGVSRRHEVSAQVTYAVTGNAPEIHRDFYRRTIPIYMGVGKARAWERKYSNPNIHREVLENRNLYLSAVLSILTHWRDLGMPLSDKTIRGFDRWSAVMGGVLEAIGLPHLLEARDGLDELIEVDNSDLDLLIAAWQDGSRKDDKLKCKDLVRVAEQRDLLTELHENRSESAAAGELGKFLKPYINDVFGEVYLRREFDSDAKTWRYFLEPVPEAPRVLSEVFTFKPIKTPVSHPRSTPVNPTEGTTTGVVRGSTGEDSQEIEETDALTFENLVGATEGEL